MKNAKSAKVEIFSGLDSYSSSPKTYSVTKQEKKKQTKSFLRFVFSRLCLKQVFASKCILKNESEV